MCLSSQLPHGVCVVVLPHQYLAMPMPTSTAVQATSAGGGKDHFYTALHIHPIQAVFFGPRDGYTPRLQ